MLRIEIATYNWVGGNGKVIYEHLCPKCKEVFEIMRPMSKADDSATCPKCHGQGKRLLSVFASTADSRTKVPDKEPFRLKNG